MLCVVWRRCLGTSTVRVGASATLSKSFTEAEGAEFARLTGDVNPAHFWDGFAQSLRRPGEAQGQTGAERGAVDERSGAVVHAGPLLDRKCCHGVMVLGLVSALVGTRLPGPGAVLMAHNITYRRPVYYDERVTAHGKVSHVREDKGIVKMEVSVVKENGTVALDGDVTVMATVGRDGKPLPSLTEHAAQVKGEGPPRLRWEPTRPGAGWGDDFPVGGSSSSSSAQ